MNLIWLSEHDPTDDTYHASKQPYLPADIDIKCHCGQAKQDGSDKCTFCSHHFQELIRQSADEGEICQELLEILEKRTEFVLVY